jgi:hypothetical protein
MYLKIFRDMLTIQMNKFFNIFNEIKKQISYIINDNDIIYSSKYFKCLNEILIVLKNTLYKIQGIYYKYVLNPKLTKVCHNLNTRETPFNTSANSTP